MTLRRGAAAVRQRDAARPAPRILTDILHLPIHAVAHLGFCGKPAKQMRPFDWLILAPNVSGRGPALLTLLLDKYWHIPGPVDVLRQEMIWLALGNLWTRPRTRLGPRLPKFKMVASNGQHYPNSFSRTVSLLPSISSSVPAWPAAFVPLTGGSKCQMQTWRASALACRAWTAPMQSEDSPEAVKMPHSPPPSAENLCRVGPG